MPNIGPLELVIVLVIVLVIFGPKRLPGLGRSLGTGMREFKDSVTGKDKDEERAQLQTDARADGDAEARQSAHGEAEAVTHDDRLTVVEHLDELRTRIVVALAAFGVALALCFWQNHLLLHWLNKPLHGKQPITFGVAEAFTTTLTVTVYAALVLALPVILYQLYAYILPAFTPREARVAKPLLIMIPLLFVGGALFGYFLVVPAATKFLLHFNADEFNTQIRARDYYYFVTTTMLACGAVFQMPVVILAATRLGITSADKLRKNRRYAYLICTIIAAALPGVDPISMCLEALPLILLFELSILLAKAFGRPSGEIAERWASAEGS